MCSSLSWSKSCHCCFHLSFWCPWAVCHLRVETDSKVDADFFCFSPFLRCSKLASSSQPKTRKIALTNNSHRKFWAAKHDLLSVDTQQNSHPPKYAQLDAQILVKKVRKVSDYGIYLWPHRLFYPTSFCLFLLRCLWKRHKVVLEQTLVQTSRGLCFNPPCQPSTK